MKRAGRFLCVTILMGTIFIQGWQMIKGQIPDQIFVAQDGRKEELLSEILPQWIEEKAVEAGNSRNIECSLLGVLPIKEIQVEVVERKQLIPGGIPVGIYMKTEGVLVIGTGEVYDMDGNLKLPVGEIIQIGDYILEVNGVPVSEKEEVVEQINNAKQNQINLKILRAGEEIELSCPVIQTAAEEYKAGIWIRDDTQGIGTLTYLEEDTGFGALGHGISDIDTSTLLTLEDGNLYRAEIKAIVKGENGMPGELAGIIRYRNDNIMGNIYANTERGIFGEITVPIEELENTEAMPVAYKQEIRQGKAAIRCSVSGEIEEYEIEIEKVNMNSNDANKGMVIRVTDQRLLEITGGIIQGMSGSPIIQDGKIVGAVTHVLVNDPTRGYGIFIENMLDAAG